MKRSDYRYVLGDSSGEARRLDRQARLWDPVARELFDRIGVRRGWRVLEIGPGRGSVHAELRRRVRGAVDAVEPSAAFAAAVRERARDDGLGEGRLWPAALRDVRLPSATYDLVYARWVFCFLPSPLAHLRRLAAALRPRGLLALQDYAHRESFALFPRPTDWLDFLAADRELFAAHGGDVSIAGRLPWLLERAGLELIDAQPVSKSGGPRSPLWDWLWTYFRSFRRRLAEIPPLDRAKANRLYREWTRAARLPHARVFAPTMMDLVARKRGRA